MRILIFTTFVFFSIKTFSNTVNSEEQPARKKITLKVKDVKTNIPAPNNVEGVSIDDVGDKLQYLVVSLGLQSPTFTDDSYSTHAQIAISKPLLNVFSYNLLGWHNEFGLFKASGTMSYENNEDRPRYARDFGFSYNTGVSMLIGKPESFGIVPHVGLGVNFLKGYDYLIEEDDFNIQYDLMAGVRINLFKIYWLNIVQNFHQSTIEGVDDDKSILVFLGIGATPSRP